MTDFRDAESTFQQGLIDFQEFLDEFMTQWYEPLYKTAIALFKQQYLNNPQVETTLAGAGHLKDVFDQMLGGKKDATLPVSWTGNLPELLRGGGTENSPVLPANLPPPNLGI